MDTSNTQLGSSIFLDRDKTREAIAENVKNYMDLQDVELSKSSFLTFVIDTLSTLSSNTLFYQSSVFRDYFLSMAQTPQAVKNRALELGYTPNTAVAAMVDVSFDIEMNFPEEEFENGKYLILGGPSGLEAGFKVKSKDGVIFQTYYDLMVKIESNGYATVTASRDGMKELITSRIVSGFLNFTVPMLQVEVVPYEYSVNLDVKPAQFVSFDCKISDQITSVDVEVDEGKGYVNYKEYSSPYLIPKNEYGYVVTKISSGYRVSFGNGLVGYQPAAGSKVKIEFMTTKGKSGNISSYSVSSCDRVYCDSNVHSNTSLPIAVTVYNTFASKDGKDEESIEEIRANAMTNFTSRERLVSKYDYSEIDKIISDVPISSISVPILKRSDLKCNEIVLFTVLEHNDTILPTLNLTAEFDVDSTSYIYRNTVLSHKGKDYYTLFDIIPDKLNSCAYYNYVIKKIQQVPIFVLTNKINGTDYDFIFDTVTAEKINDKIKLSVKYYSGERDSTSCETTVYFYNDDKTYPMVHDSTNYEFYHIFNNYESLPVGECKMEFNLYSNRDNVKRLTTIYSTTLIFRQELKEFMMSNMLPVDGTNFNHVKIYDIPVLSKEYYDNLYNKDLEQQDMYQVDLETNCIHSLIQSFKSEDYRMISDFINLKFCNTYATTENMQFNTVTKPSVLDIVNNLPVDSTSGQRYIYVNNNDFINTNKIAIAVDSTSWLYTTPVIDDMVFVNSKNKKYIYTRSGWVVPEYDIPLKLELVVFKNSKYNYNDLELSELIKDSLIHYFETKFGPDKELYLSEIIDVVQSIAGVQHCDVVSPQSNIFFNFSTKSLTQQQLLEYSPTYIHFNKEDIVIRIV